MKSPLKYLLCLCCACVALVGISSCAWTAPKEKPIVTVTILPQKYFAEYIAGDRFEINCIVPAGSNPEAYDPSPSHLVHLGKSMAYFRIGQIGFEVAWMDKLVQNNPSMKVYDNSNGVHMLVGVHTHEHDGKMHESLDIDPHIWSSPKNAYIIARNMYEAFVELDPDGRDYYRDNYEALLDRIEEVDSTVTEVLSRVPGRTFAIYHPTLSYLAEDYGVVQLCLENAGKESSALHLKQVIDEARESDVRVVFVQREFNAKQVETFAAETGARIAIINPLNYDWDKEIIRIAYAIAAD